METWKYKAKNSLMYYPEGEWRGLAAGRETRAAGVCLVTFELAFRACVCSLHREVLVHVGVGDV